MTRKHEYAPMTNTPVMRGMQATLDNSIICGDCKDKLKHVPSGSVDLIYLDPPFFSGRDYDDIWKDGAAMVSFQDTNFYKKVCGNEGCGLDFPEHFLFCPQCGASVEAAKDVRMNDIEAYIGWLRARMQECYRVLKQTGSIYVHLDWHAVHYVKVMMDEIFGMNNFRNEIVWHYITAPATKKNFGRKHDTILFYGKSNKNMFNVQRVPHSKNTSATRVYKHGGKDYVCNTNPDGKVMDDVWDMPIIAAMSKERLGYPTQKPEALLERIIKASSNPGDVVLDPFCGCGTSISVAQKLGRRWIGIDVSPTSCRAMVARLKNISFTDSTGRNRRDGYPIDETDIIDMPHTNEDIRDMEPFEFQNWAVNQIGGTQSHTKSGDRGIDGWTYMVHDPIQVKQSGKVGNPVVRLFAQDIRDVDKTHGIIIALSYSAGARDEVEHIKAKYGIDIELKTVADLVD